MMRAQLIVSPPLGDLSSMSRSELEFSSKSRLIVNKLRRPALGLNHLALVEYWEIARGDEPAARLSMAK